MAFGLNVKVEAPKVEVPKVDVAAAAKSAASAATGAVSGAVDSAKSAANSAVDSAKGAVNNAVGAVTGAVNSAVDAATDAVESVKESLSTVAGAIADVAVSFTGAIEDFVLEPHLQLDANASFGKTKFEKGPIKVIIAHTPAQAAGINDEVHLFCSSGVYDRKMRVNEFTSCGEHTVKLQFNDAPMDERYSLEIIRSDGRIKRMFSDVAYGDLRRTKQRFV